MVVRNLKGLEDVISFSVVSPYLRERGWTFDESIPGCTNDPINSAKELREIYLKSAPEYSGSITVPVLFDKKTMKIVNNESAEIIRMFNSEFNHLATRNKELDLYPSHLREQIDELNSWIYTDINNGVYKCGFARSQQAYSEAFHKLFTALDKVEAILSKSRYLTGNSITEADVRLFTTLLRFDIVYYVHFKCNGKRLIDYPNLWGFVKDIFQTGHIKDTVNVEQIKTHYYASHLHINPFGIIPHGPFIDFSEPHTRNKQFSTSDQK
eukprot:TRINITY_DN1276_c0_g1_i1.p1 TRINITY_DN1276_c0_g1~~TRINITY_DN1276_c0_g1_i1.p1  ORF type:complete len:267 (+),score=35.37 TRINITY_DN1276_c0_g1_i1:281-1081(+)